MNNIKEITPYILKMSFLCTGWGFEISVKPLMYIVRVSSCVLTWLLAVFFGPLCSLFPAGIYIRRIPPPLSLHHSLLLLPSPWQTPCISSSRFSPPLASNESRNTGETDGPPLPPPALVTPPDTGVAPAFLHLKISRIVCLMTAFRWETGKKKKRQSAF